jgi:hypothetical protein
LAAAITFEKLISVDGGLTFLHAPEPPGPTLIGPPNSAYQPNPVYEFIITNTGDEPLTGTLTDSMFGTHTFSLGVGAPPLVIQEMGTFMPGQNVNHATVTASSPTTRQTVTASDSANYFGAEVAIALTKEISVDGGSTFLSDTAPPGPALVAPTSPVYRYTITNEGNVPLSMLTLTDSVLGDLTVPVEELGPGDSVPVTATGTFAVGTNCNSATAGGTFETATVTASSSACYFGSVAPCEVVAYQEVCLEADIAVDPTVTVGPATVVCIAAPAIHPFGTVTCEPTDVPCGFTVQATLCVAVPVSFAATADPVATRVQCQAVGDTSCLPDGARLGTVA